ncbi:MAG: hypothetical protein WDN69_31815 [Aliidongia sp.]
MTIAATAALAADKPYTEGTVWTMSTIRVKPGQFEAYMRDILPMRKKIDEEAKKEGLLLSSHVLSGQSSNSEDFDLVILEEYKNFAAFDGISAKYDAILAKIGSSEEQQTQTMEKRVELRTILGEKTLQEIVPK